MNLFLRSPYHIHYTDTDLVSVVVKIYVYSGTKDVFTASDLKYEQVITSLDSTTVMFNISPFIKDYLDVQYNVATSAEKTVWATYQIDATTTSGTTSNAQTDTFACYEGYTYFEEGNQANLTDSYLLQSNDIIYIPYGQQIVTQYLPINEIGAYLVNGTALSSTGGSVGEDETSTGRIRYFGVSLSSFSTPPPEWTYSRSGTINLYDNAAGTGTPIKTYQVKALDECKETPYRVTFINKFGALQFLWFFKKSIVSLETEKSEYRANIITDSPTYDTTKHQYKTFNKSGKQKITLNSGFVDESYDEVFRQLMLSEKVWIDYESSNLPINISNSNMTFKTKLNDKLINYTIEADFAFDKINTIN